MLEFFKSELSESDEIKIAIVGVGNLGRALLTYNFSIHAEMTITEAFDIRRSNWRKWVKSLLKISMKFNLH